MLRMAFGEGVEKRPAEQPHEAGEADERHVARAQLRDEHVLEGVAASGSRDD